MLGHGVFRYDVHGDEKQKYFLALNWLQQRKKGEKGRGINSEHIRPILTASYYTPTYNDVKY